MSEPRVFSSTVVGTSRPGFVSILGVAAFMCACEGRVSGESEGRPSDQNQGRPSEESEGNPPDQSEAVAFGESGDGGNAENGPETTPVGGSPGALEDDGTEDDPLSVCTTEDAGPTPMRQLTATEYRKTIFDLTGLEVDIEGYPAVTVTEGFDNNVELLNVGAALATFLQKRAEFLASELVEDEPFLADYAGCDDGLSEVCASDLVTHFGARVLRRPISAEEHEQFLELYRWGEDQTDEGRGTRLVLQALLQDPHFIHRVEQGTSGKASGYEIATRLSYLLWQSMPDAELFAAAESGELDTREGIEAQTRRMMETPEFSDTVASFHRQWLQLDVVSHAEKDPELYPDFTSDLRAQLRVETEELVKDVVTNGSFGDLFTATHAFLNEETAPIYGVEDVSGSELQRVELDPDERRGILTRVGFLAAWATSDGTSPIKRGAFIRERILCAPLPPPPADVDNTTPPVDETLTRREQTEQLTSAEACTGCHTLINSTGFLFENYDTVGAFREVENGQQIDASAEIQAAGDANGIYENAREFSEALAESKQVRACAVSNWWQFSTGRHAVPADDCAVERIEQRFTESNGDIAQLLVDIALSDTFRNRTLEE